MQLFMWLKSMYFLGMNRQFAPLINIMMVIIHEIGYFLLIFAIGIVALTHALFLIGHNQKDLKYYQYTQENQRVEMAKLEKNSDDLKTAATATLKAICDRIHCPSYVTLIGAFDNMLETSLVSFATDDYLDNEMTGWLLGLFVLNTFFMSVLLLNMLIAIMGDVFIKNNEIKDYQNRVSQLAFVVDNWWIDPVPDKEKIVYLIAGHDKEENDDCDEEECWER